MSLRARPYLIALALLFPGSLLRAEPPAPPSKEAIAQWVKQLGDTDFATREKASDLLWKAGRAAEPALEGAVTSDDAEVKRRCQELLDKFRWGIYPDTPPKIVELIRRYQAADAPGKLTLVRALVDEGGPGVLSVLKIAATEDEAALRKDIFQLINQESPRFVPQALADGNYSLLEQLLDVSLAHDLDSGITNYVAYYLLRGKLDERIEFFKRQPDRKGYPASAEVPTYLYRARGDAAAARQTAEKVGKKELIEWILYEQGDWKELARRGSITPGDASSPMEALGFRATYERLAGNKEGFDKVVAEIRDRVASIKSGEDDLPAWLGAKALLLNDRPEEALALLAKSRDRMPTLEILLAQHRFADAFALVDKAQADGHRDLKALQVLQARVFYQLGEKDKALQLFAKLAEEIKEGNNPAWSEALVDTELRLGLKEQALTHCARMLAQARDETTAPHLLGKVYPQKGEIAEAWWRFLWQKYSQEGAAGVIKRLHAVMTGKAPASDLDAWIGEAEQSAKELKAEEREVRLRACAEACLAAGREGEARAYLEKAASVAHGPHTLLILADFLAERKEWQRAAERYGQAWEKDRKDPLPLHLRGWALLQAGAEKEGKKCLELAHWLPLGNESTRNDFADALAERGQVEAARREWQFLLQVHASGSLFEGDAQRHQGFDALARKDYLKAADLHERAMLRVLHSYVNFMQTGAYLGVPQHIHRYRARGLINAGRFEEARRELDLCQALMPMDVELPVAVVPDLDRKGRQKEADALYNKVAGSYEKLCKEYPKSAWAHNSRAWLSACCRRQLDQGLEHARKAVELAPESPGYLDTLAEVHFQRGEKDKALELMKRCLALEPKNHYYRKQLERFQAGDRMTDLPSSPEDE